MLSFFFQAEDGIRDLTVTGVQTCALPILMAKEVIERKFGWRVMPDRVANLTVPHRGRPACHYCDQCQRGCFTASYFNSPSVTLPAAAKTGKFTLVSDAIVSHVVMDAGGRAKGVGYIDRVTHEHREADAR